MRLISQDCGVDIPYEMSALIIKDFGSKAVIFASSMFFREKTFVLASYPSAEKALKVMKNLRKVFSKAPDYGDEYFEDLVFQFPKDDEV